MVVGGGERGVFGFCTAVNLNLLSLWLNSFSVFFVHNISPFYNNDNIATWLVLKNTHLIPFKTCLGTRIGVHNCPGSSYHLQVNL